MSFFVMIGSKSQLHLLVADRLCHNKTGISEFERSHAAEGDLRVT